MNINISLIGQMITFGILIWVTMKYVWPPLIGAIDRRNKEIAEGLDAAAQGKQALDDATARKDELINQGRAKQSEHIADGKRQHDEIVASAASDAEAERERIIAEGRKTVEQERLAMTRELQASYADLVVAGASKILRREVDAKAHQDIVDEMIKDI
jgi:F-type H+-transporting ATPase subunit b